MYSVLTAFSHKITAALNGKRLGCRVGLVLAYKSFNPAPHGFGSSHRSRNIHMMHLEAGAAWPVISYIALPGKKRIDRFPTSLVLFMMFSSLDKVVKFDALL